MENLLFVHLLCKFNRHCKHCKHCKFLEQNSLKCFKICHKVVNYGENIGSYFKVPLADFNTLVSYTRLVIFLKLVLASILAYSLKICYS